MASGLINSPKERVRPEEAVLLGAGDSIFYSQYFFPRTVRQRSPAFHRDIWNRFERPGSRYISVMVFRDGGKTTLCRLFTSKRIAYGISHTIVYVSNSEGHSRSSIEWIAKQVEHNYLWASTFQLKKGRKWNEREIEIFHGVDEYPIRLLAVGITGQIRGINFDDFRPDLIVSDDSDNEETTATKEQREKAGGLFFGALVQGLASPTESTEARAVNLATPQAKGDVADLCSKDPLWDSTIYGCFDEKGESRWEEKFPTEYLKREKEAYIARRQLAIWMKEKECKIVSEEMSAFSLSWLQKFHTRPENLWHMVAIDPARSDDPHASRFAMILLGVQGRKRFVLDSFAARGVDPDAALAVLFGWHFKFPLRFVSVESVAYQQVLAWYLRKEMTRQKLYFPVYEYDDRTRKDDRILQAIQAHAPFGELFVNDDQTELLEEYASWRPGGKETADLLDALSIGLKSLEHETGDLETEFKRIIEEERNVPRLERAELAP